MLKSIIFVLIILGIFFMTTREDGVQENHSNPIEAQDTPKKTNMDSLSNSYKTRIEAQNIANTINTSNSYLGSRLDARGGAKNSIKDANQRVNEQDKAMEALLK